MPRPLVEHYQGRPLFDIASYASRGITRRDRLSPAELAHIDRTVRRTPEVMIKILTHGSPSLSAVRRHLDYIGRKGALALESDDGERLKDRDAYQALLKDWDLDLEATRQRSNLTSGARRSSPKLVHKMIFSMPPGTPPDKLLTAVRNFAREEFGLKHRYAMVLHTDEPHPHVHMMVKAVSEQGARLNIRKATLRAWRAEFAHHLRAVGVAANATERAVRGQTQRSPPDGLYRARERGASYSATVPVTANPKKVTVTESTATGRAVQAGWRVLRKILLEEGRTELARATERFVSQMSPPERTR